MVRTLLQIELEGPGWSGLVSYQTSQKNTLDFEFFSFSFIFLWCGRLWLIPSMSSQAQVVNIE